MKKNILVGQSGGPTSVINASLYGVITGSMAHSDVIHTVYGMVNGIEGFLSGAYMDLFDTLNSEQLQLLKQTPAAYLGSCRFKLPENLEDPVYPLLFQRFKALKIGICLYIGGNDSMDTVDKLSRFAALHQEEIRFIGVPKTIDNDLPVTDHTPGYGSAAKYVASTLREISLDSSVYQKPSVTIVELMGRHAGWITAASCLARRFPGDNPLLIYMPEVPFDMDHFLKDLKEALAKQPNVVVCVSEGIQDKSGKLICEFSSEAQVDTFGHKALSGCGKLLEQYVRSQLSIKVRSVELNVNQRCSGLLASKEDVEEAVMAGQTAVKAGIAGETGKMVIFTRQNKEIYELEYGLTPVGNVCNKEKKFPVQWIAENHRDILPEFQEYAMPLLQGEIDHIKENGLPKYISREQEK